MRFILASESARRVDLLRAAGYDFETRKSGFPEVTLGEEPLARPELRRELLDGVPTPHRVILLRHHAP